MSDTSFPGYAPNTTYSHLPRDFGNPAMNLMMSMMFGHNLMPSRDDGQSMYDALIQRQRSQHFMELQRSGAANNMLFKALGVNNNSMARSMSAMAMSSPDSMLGRLMSPLLGGNPMAASMQLYGGLAGASVMGNFGRASNISVEETEDTMSALLNNIYKTQDYEGAGGVKEELNKRTQNHLLTLAKNKKNDKYLQDLGVNVTRDSQGELTEDSKQSLASFEVAESSGDAPDQKKTNIKYRIASKRMLSSQLNEQLEEIEKLGDEDKTKVDKVKALKQSLETDMGLSKSSVDTLISKDKIGSKESTNVKKAISEYAELDKIEKAYEEGQSAKEAGKKYKGFKFENTRGFKVEDFTSAFVKAADVRALGDSRGMSIAGKMSEFSENAGGAMSAARSLFGNKSGGELISKMSSMMDANMDLSSQEGAGKAEKMLRDVKATADVAGISIKTMLGIIDATNELASNNPRLSTMSKQATTAMALSAVTKAADLGTTMSAKEYRQAGGNQGIVSAETTSREAYLSSGLGQQQAALGAVLQGLGETTDENGNTYSPFKRYLESVKSGEMAKALTSGKGGEFIEKITKGQVSAADASRIVTDKNAALRGMKNTDVAEALNASKDTVVADEGWKDLKKYGVDRDAIVKEYEKERKEKGDKGRSVQEILRSRVTQKIAGDANASKVYDTHEIAFVEDIKNATRTPQEKARIAERKKERAETDARIDKEYAANQSPIAQQFFGALMEGKSFGDTADLMGGIFATKDYKKQGTKEAVESAKKAGQEISDISAKAKGSQSKMLEMGIDSALNKFIGGRKAEALERGADASHLRTNISAQEFEQEAQTLQHVQGTDNAQQAKSTLVDLEDASKKGKLDKSPKLQAALQALRTANAAGHLDSDEALKKAKSGTLQGVSAATIQAQTDTNLVRLQREEKSKSISKLGETLQADIGKPGNQDTKEALDFYSKKLGKKATDPAVLERMLEDFQNPSKRGKGENFFIDEKTGKFKEKLKDSNLGETLKSTQSEISYTEQKLKGADKGKDAAGDANKPLIDAINALVSKIGDGGGFASALSDLATALRGI